MEESSLRLVLLGLGIVILVGIYLYDLWQKKKRLKLAEHHQAAEEKIEPIISSEPVQPISLEGEPVIKQAPVQEEPPIVSTKAEVIDSVEEIPVAQQAMVVQLAVVSKPGMSMQGDALMAAFTALNLEYGDMKVFHRYQGSGDARQQCFLVTNMLEPGTFPVDNMVSFESTGLMLFFQASDSIDAIAVFDEMLAAAESLAEYFDAKLIDAQMSELSEQKILEIRSQLKSLSGL